MKSSRLAKRVGASIEILKTINKGARKTQKRIGPVAPQLRRFTKCGNSVGQIALSFRNSRRARLASPLIRLRCPSQ